jgi:diguanylate cyclase (GGDEF)-like protein
VRYDRGDITIEDHESTNGTYVNDRRVISQSVLRSGDRFQVGSVHFKFLHELDIESAYHDAIYQLAIHDGITGVFNRSRYDEEIEREFSRARRHKRPLGLMLFDIDNFKEVNDTYGHLFGDFVLQDLAHLVGKILRQEQIFARVGGDEFSIICPETNTEGTELLGKRIAESIAGHQLAHQGVSLKITCSFGISGITEDDLTSRDLYARTDRALYQSKNAGRNLVSVL